MIKPGDKIIIRMFPPLRPVGKFHVEVVEFTPGMKLKVKFNNGQEMDFPLEYIDDTYVQLEEDQEMPRPAPEDAIKKYQDAVTAAIKESELLCIACAKGEKVVTPPRSGIVGLASVHSSGMICIPNTIRALIKEKLDDSATKPIAV